MSKKLNNYVPTNDILVNRYNDLKNVEFPGTECNFKSEELSLIKLEGRNKLLGEAMDYEKLMHKKQDMVNQLRRKETKSLEECVQIDKLDGDIKYLSNLIKEII